MVPVIDAPWRAGRHGWIMASALFVAGLIWLSAVSLTVEPTTPPIPEVTDNDTAAAPRAGARPPANGMRTVAAGHCHPDLNTEPPRAAVEPGETSQPGQPTLTSLESPPPAPTEHAGTRSARDPRAAPAPPSKTRRRRSIQQIDLADRAGDASPDQVESARVGSIIENLRVVGASGLWRTLFDVTLTNRLENDETVYVVVYARNDTLAPPRRWAWPWPGSIFDSSFTSTGQLSADLVMRNWSERPGRARGVRVTLPPLAVRTLKASIPLNPTSPHEEWLGQQLGAWSYREYHLWTFTPEGDLLSEKRYETRPVALE